MTSLVTPGRLEAARRAMTGAGVDALIVSQPENRSYLSGFTGSTAILLVAPETAYIATDSRYWEQAEMECPGYELAQVRGQVGPVVKELVARCGAQRVGFEAQHATYADAEDWRNAAPDVEWIPTRDLVTSLRATKDGEEIAVLRRAVALADAAIADALARMRPDMKEREVAWMIESYFRTHGAEGPSFETIVACGPNGARPHARAGDAPIVRGQPIVIDMGAKLDGYCSDLTRTVCLGEPDEPERFWSVYNTVLRAQLAAEVAVKPGVAERDVDSVARDIITAAGYGENFGHGLGHGVGLAIHEYPRLSQLADGTLKAGHVVTVEPGIYLTGWGGIRIEDIALVTETGVEILTQAPKDPILRLP